MSAPRSCSARSSPRSPVRRFSLAFPFASVNMKTGKLRKSPDIISRGFVYLRENQDMLNQARLLIKKTVEDSTHGMNPVDLDYVKNNLTDVMAGFLFTRTNKAPMVIPVLIGM